MKTKLTVAKKLREIKAQIKTKKSVKKAVKKKKDVSDLPPELLAYRASKSDEEKRLQKELNAYVKEAESLPKKSKLRKVLLKDADRIREALRKIEIPLPEGLCLMPKFAVTKGEAV